MKTRLLVILAIAATCPGCVYTSYEQHGVKLTRISLFGNQSVGRIDLAKGTMSGYESEQAQVAGAVVGAAVDAAVKAAVKP